MVRRVVRVVAASALVALGVWILAPVVVSAQAVSWSPPMVMGKDWFPDVATDPFGRVHVVWASSEEPYDLVMYRTSVDGRVWSEPNDIMALYKPIERYATRPSILVGGDNDQPLLHMGFRGDTLWVSESPLATANIALSWRTPTLVAPGGYFSKLTKTSDGRVYLLFTQNFPDAGCQNCFHLMSQHTDDGANWSTPVDISVVRGGTAKPQVLVDQADRLHVVFEAGYGGDLGQLQDPATVMYAVSQDRGENWSAPVRLDPTRGDSVDAQARNVTIGLGQQQELVVVWWGIPDDLIYSQISRDQGRTWSAPTPLPNVWGIWAVYHSRLDSFTMATDSAGVLHLILVGRRNPEDTTLNVLHLAWDGAAWSSPALIATFEKDIPEWPRLAIGNGNRLHAVWFVRNAASLWQSDGATDYKIWYAQGASSAPAVAPVATAIPTPVSSNGVAATPVVTMPVATMPVATLMPVVVPPLMQAPGEPVSIQALKTENDDLILFTKSLAPVLFVVIAVALIVHRQRRDDSSPE